MGQIFTRLRGLKNRVGERRSARRANAGERALKRKAAKAQRLEHERLEDKYVGPGGP